MQSGATLTDQYAIWGAVFDASEFNQQHHTVVAQEGDIIPSTLPNMLRSIDFYSSAGAHSIISVKFSQPVDLIRFRHVGGPAPDLFLLKDLLGNQINGQYYQIENLFFVYSFGVSEISLIRFYGGTFYLDDFGYVSPSSYVAPLPCGEVAHDRRENRIKYRNEFVPFGSICVSEIQLRTCIDGAFTNWTGVNGFEFDDCYIQWPESN
jgi:hypothetical protein